MWRAQLIIKEEIRKLLQQKEGCMSSTRNIDGTDLSTCWGTSTNQQSHVLFSDVLCIRRFLADSVVFIVRFFSQFGCTGKQIQDQIIKKATSVAAPGYL